MGMRFKETNLMPQLIKISKYLELYAIHSRDLSLGRSYFECLKPSDYLVLLH